MSPKTHFRSLATAIVFVLVITVAATMSAASADGGDDEVISVEKSEQQYPNLGSQLNYIVSNVREGQMSAGDAAGDAALFDGESVAVTIDLWGHVDEVVAFLEEFGGDPRNVGEDYIEAYVPVTLLGSLSQQPGVDRVRQIIPPQPAQLSQQIIGDGPELHGSQAWNAAGYSGQGVKVGVIDLSFRGVTTLLGTELPATIIARCYEDVGLFTSDLNDCEPSGEAPDPPRGCPPVTPSPGGHGTIVAESLLDMAPGVTLYVADPYSRGDLLETVEWMASEGVQVINYSVGYVFDGPGDGTSPSSLSPLNTVDRAVENDILWVNSAGNSADGTWFGDYSDSDGDLFLDFGGSIEEVIEVPVYECERHVVQLRWEDSWTAARTDLDLHLYNKVTNEIVFSSDDLQTGATGHEPWEAFAFTLPFRSNTYGIKVNHYSGEIPDWIQVTGWTVFPIEPHTLAGSVNNPSESANLGLLAVGAAPWYKVDIIEPYSSRGPTPDGRTKPEIVAVDCGETALRSYRPNTNRAFCGTSQSAPHVSGMAALVRQRFPEYSAQQTATYLKVRSEERGPVPNNTWGYGFAQLPPQDALPSASGAAIIEGIDDCGETISGDGATPGTWTSACRSSEAGRGYARYYSFTLDQESQVTIDLESDLDTYLYVRRGDARAGGFLYENDDVDRLGGDFDSQISETLAAGSYTIEATTFGAGQLGSFTLAISGLDEPTTAPGTGDDCGETISGDGATPGTWTSACRSSEAGRGYARYYSFTLDQESQVTIDLESDLDTYLYVRRGDARAGGFLYENDDVDRLGGDFDSQISETLAAGSYTIEATTFGAGQLGSFTLAISGLDEPTTAPGTGDDCGETISGDGATPGTWTSACRSSEAGRGYARYYSFTLDQESQVTIDLESDLDTYLYVRRGDARAGGFLYENDDVDRLGGDYDSQIRETLGAGSYTIEATTFGADQGGSFTLTISGLGTVPPATTSDRDGLVAFFNATDGSNWRDSANWLTDVPIEEWYGVSTDGGGRVTALTLPGNQLTGGIPTELGNLINLEGMDLSGNQLTGAIPTELGNLVKLESIDLSANQLTGPIPTGLGTLENLQTVSLAGNRLIGCIPESLRDVPDNDFSLLRLPFCGPNTSRDSFPLTATGGSGEVTLNWADQAGIDTWQVRWRAEDEFYFASWTGSSPVTIVDDGGTDPYATIAPLFNAVRYCFQVRSLQNNTPGPSSNEACAITAAAPEQADDLNATAGIGQVTLTWDNPTDDSITEWQYRYTTAGSFAATDLWKPIPRSSSDTTSYTVENLQSGKEYTFEVRALSHDTPGPAAEPEFTGSNVVTLQPGPPVGLGADSGDEQVTLSWSDPDDDGIYKWQYKYRGGPGEFGEWTDVFVAGAGENPTDAATKAATAAATTVVATNLTNGVEYAFQVRAVATEDPSDVMVNATARTVTAPADADVAGPGASVTHFLEVPTAAAAVEGGIPNQIIGLGERRVLDLSVFFVDGQGAGAIDGYHGNVSPNSGPLFARISSAGVMTMVGLSEGVAAVEITAIDGYDSDGNGDVADDDPSLLFVVTVRDNS